MKGALLGVFPNQLSDLVLTLEEHDGRPFSLHQFLVLQDLEGRGSLLQLGDDGLYTKRCILAFVFSAGRFHRLGQLSKVTLDDVENEGEVDWQTKIMKTNTCFFPPLSPVCFLSDAISLLRLLKVDSSCKTVDFNFWTWSGAPLPLL